MGRVTVEPANGLHTVWSKIVGGDIIKEGKDNRQWKLGGGALWLDEVDILYNREVYDKLLIDMEGKHLVLVKGTPGIGKTTFLERVLVHIVENCRAESKDIPSIVLAVREKGAVKEYWLNSDGTVEEFELRVHRRGPDIYLSDSVDSDSVQGFVLHLEVASSRDSNYNQFVKHVQVSKAGLDTYMGLFSFEELCEIRGNMTEEEVRFRYTIVGGSARNFKAAFPTDITVLGFVEEVLEWIVRDTDWMATFEEAFVGYCRFISERLNKSGLEGFHVMNSLLRHNVGGKSEWASKTMEIIGAEILKHREVTLSGELEGLLRAGGMGNFFESLMHRKVTRHDYKCIVKPLYKSHARGVARDGVDIKINYPVALVRSVEDIGNLGLGRYGLPIFENFPLVDAIVQPDTLIQYTVSPNSHKGAVAQLVTIRQHLLEKDSEKHKMIFVVPAANLRTFKWQKSLGGIAQYVASDEEVVSVLSLYTDSELRAAKKQKLQ